jgi:uncharacterized membrane protein YczE
VPAPARPTSRAIARSVPGRLAVCVLGIVLLGFGVSLTVRADLGLSPWDVLHQGLADKTGIPMGTISIVVGAVVLLAWIPLRQRPGIATVLNVVGVGLVIDLCLAVLPETSNLAARWALLLAGLVLLALATGLYIGAGLGSGPRDGLMMGFASRGISVRVARTAVELVVLGTGFLLGGRVGIGTVVLAVGIGPLVHVALDRLATAAHQPPRPEPALVAR